MIAKTIKLANRQISTSSPAFIVAEMSANHCRNFDRAVELVHAAKEAGADAIKFQTYTAETMTIDCRKKWFTISGGTPWDGKTLFELYEEAFTPWDWQPKLIELAHSLELECFSTPFDSTAVDFLETLNVPVYKVASFELVDIPLIKRIAKTGKPIIISTGMASDTEISDALEACGDSDVILLKCISAYPAPLDQVNLRQIPTMQKQFNTLVGLSDHTLGSDVAIAAIALGARVLEKHLTISRDIAGPDSAFSMEPNEFKSMVESIRNVEAALGQKSAGTSPAEAPSKAFRRSIFVVQTIKAGDELTENNIRIIRPGHGLAPKHFHEILGKKAAKDIDRGTPLERSMILD